MLMIGPACLKLIPLCIYDSNRECQEVRTDSYRFKYRVVVALCAHRHAHTYLGLVEALAQQC